MNPKQECVDVNGHPTENLQSSKEPHSNEGIDEVDDEDDGQHAQGEHKHIRQNSSNLLHTLPVPFNANKNLTYNNLYHV